MSIVHTTYMELRRLCIAGGELAAADSRLVKLAATLQAAAEKAPVFGRLASLIQEATLPQTAARIPLLLDAAALARAILCAQAPAVCKTTEEADFIPLADYPAGTDHNWTTCEQRSFKSLQPILEALTTTGGGRYEIIEEGRKSGCLQDPRLLPALLHALEDPYSMIPPLAAAALCAIGKPALPGLLQAYDPTGKENAQIIRLRLIADMLGDEGKDMYLHAWDNGSPDVRVAALEQLGAFPEFAPIVFSAVKERKKNIRIAALRAAATLAGQIDQPVLQEEATALLITALQGPEFNEAAASIGQSSAPQLMDAMLAEGKTFLAAAEALLAPGDIKLGKNPCQTSSAAARLAAVLGGIKDCPEKTPAMETFAKETLAFIVKYPGLHLEYPLETFSHSSYASVRMDHFFLTMIAETLASFQTDQALEALTAYLQADIPLTGGYIAEVAFLLEQKNDPARFFDTLAPFYASGPKSTQHLALHEFIERRLYTPTIYLQDSYALMHRQPSIPLDDRWVEHFIRKDALRLVVAMAKPGLKLVRPYLEIYLSRTSAGSGYQYYDRLLDNIFLPAIGLLKLGETSFIPGLLEKLKTSYFLSALHGKHISWTLSKLPLSSKMAALLACMPDQSRAMLQKLSEELPPDTADKKHLLESFRAEFEHEVARNQMQKESDQ